MSNIPERCVITETYIRQRMPLDNGTQGFQFPISSEEAVSAHNRIEDKKRPVMCRRCQRCNPLVILTKNEEKSYELVVIPH